MDFSRHEDFTPIKPPGTPRVPFNLYARKIPYEYVNSVRIELTKLILVGTRTTPTKSPGTPRVP